MPMTGVIPLPAVRNRILAGGGRSRVNSPVAASSDTMVPAAACRTRWWETMPPGTALTVIDRHLSARPGAEVIE